MAAMNVVALETDRNQVTAIRHVVCELVGAKLLVVSSVDQLIQALQSHGPDLMLLPALIPPAEESALITFLRDVPDHAHIDTLITPILGAPNNADGGEVPWRRWGTRRSSSTSLTPPTDPPVFAERVIWSLDRARERRIANSSRVPAAIDAVSAPGGMSTDRFLVDAPQSLLRLLTEVDGREVDVPNMSGTTARLLEKINSDRRVYPRFAANELRGFRSARIRFGPRVSVIDVSAGGALLESDARLQPESEAMLELVGSNRHVMVPFRILRCQVAALGDSLRYRGACSFKTPLDVNELLADEDPLLANLTGTSLMVVAANAW